MRQTISSKWTNNFTLKSVPGSPWFNTRHRKCVTALTSAGRTNKSFSLLGKQHSVFRRQYLCFGPIWVESRQHVSIIVPAVLRKRSRLPGVIITQFVTSVPEGKSTPDFQCKPAPATVGEGGFQSSGHGCNSSMITVTVNARHFQGKRRFSGSGSKVIRNQTCHGRKQKEPSQRMKHFRPPTTNPQESMYSRWASPPSNY